MEKKDKNYLKAHKEIKTKENYTASNESKM